MNMAAANEAQPSVDPQAGGDMSSDENERPFAALRQKAEAILKGQPSDFEGFSQQGLQSLIHELQVHQLELELQNQTLRQTQQALEVACDEYADLYEGAPVGYFSVESNGTIARANTTGAALLGTSPAALVGQPFHRFVARDSQDDYHFFLVRLSRNGGPEIAELNLTRASRGQFRARLEGLVSDTTAGRSSPRWQASVSDVSAEYEARQALRHIVEGTAAVTGTVFFQTLVQHLARLLHVHYVLLGAVDADEPGVVHSRAVWAGNDWGPDLTLDLRGSACEAVAHGQPCFCARGMHHRFPDDPLLAHWDVDSCRAWPLHDNAGQLQGVLLVMDKGPMAQEPNVEPILTLFADRAAAELARQAGETELQRYAGEQKALYTVASALTTSLEPAELAAGVLGVLLPLFEADAGWIVTAGETRSEPPRLLASQGLGQSVPQAHLLAAGIETCPAAAYLGRTGGADPGPVVECRPVPDGPLAQAGLTGCACLPLAAYGRVLGILALAWRDQHVLAGREKELLLAISQQLGLSLRNAGLYQRARQVDRLRTLVALDEALSSSLDPLEVAGLALQHIAAAVRASEAFLLPYAPSLGGQSNRVLSLDRGWIDVETSEAHRRWLRFLETLRRERRAHLAVGRPPALSLTPWGSDVLVVPLDDDVALADLVLSGRTFSDDDVALARAAAGRVGQALRNARLYDEVRVLLRQREEAEALLVQSEKVAALGRLTASFSHEINNPLQSVIGCLGLAQGKLGQGPADEAVQRYLAVALQEIRRIATLVEHMREFYRPGSEDRTPADIHGLLERVVGLTQTELREHHVAVEWQRDPLLPEPAIHADQLQQVFLNLILNAIQAMPGGGTLTLRTSRDELRHNRSKPVPAVRVEVQDTGPGIPAEVRARLFEPFFTTKHGGSGLGLYVSHRIVQEHEGQLELRSRPGRGTQAIILLPVRLPQEA
jgi:PAS domain S-box-containing protein